MQKNETVLTPIYRYLLRILEKNGLDNIDDTIAEVSMFQKHWASDVKGVDIEEKDGTDILDKYLNFLKVYKNDRDSSKQCWSETKAEIDHIECKMCYRCRKCQIYFWKELGEIFFQCKNDEKADKKYLPIRGIPENIARHLEPSIGMSELYCAQVARKSKTFQNKLIMLKGMSSSTPSMLNSIFDTDEFDGGGFFFRYQNYGVVIDPGYHFIRNLHHYGLSVLDINAVVITHEHIDHNNDMRLLDDIHFSVARYAGGECRYHKISWFLDKVTYKLASVLQSNKAGFDCKANDIYCVDPERMIYEKEGKITSLRDGISLQSNLKMFIFSTQHIYDKDISAYHKNTFGCRFVLDNETVDRTLVYTSDTRYFPELVDEIKDADVLIANISGIYEDDYMLVKEKNTHLGYYGCYNMIKECFLRYHRCPGFFILSEFWNGKSDIRYDVACQLQKELESLKIDNLHVLPAELGMVLDIIELKMQCSQCGAYSDKMLIKKPGGLYEKIDVICEKCCY